MITIAIKVMTVDVSQPEPAFLHHTVLKSCVQGVVVVPNKKTSFLYIFSRGCDCTQHENIITNPAIVTH